MWEVILPELFLVGHLATFFKVFLYYSFVILFFFTVGFIRIMPRHTYADIEHGSSDWCERGEQYRLLSRNKGILLAEKTFLPLNKMGNINVMVVGRFWFW